MNAFADTLFSILLGWVRTFTQTVWSAVSSGGASGFFTWLGDHWLILAVILCAGGALVDFLVWLLRWRPDLVWRTHLRHFSARVRGQEMRESEERTFTQGYREAVPMDTLSAPARGGYTYASVPYAQPPSAAENTSVYRRPADAWQENSASWMDAPAQPPRWEPAAQDAVPGTLSSDMMESGFDLAVPQNQPESSEMALRRRRSEKHQKKDRFAALRKVKKQLIGDADEDEQMLDGLPPVVDKKDAFHDPVYPQRDAGRS